MTKQTFIKAVGLIDDSYIAAYLNAAQHITTRAKTHTQALRRRITALVAACLVAAILVPIGVHFVPVTYDLNYQEDGDTFYYTGGFHWIYYTTDSGRITRKNVYVKPGTTPNIDNIIIIWKHLNHIDDDVRFDYNRYATKNNRPCLNVSVSENIQNYPDFEGKLEALRCTIIGNFVYEYVEFEIIKN